MTTGGTASRGHRADIQGLRAVAVLLVVLFHAELGFSGGFVGVDVFFVISGFVITAMLLTELQGTDTLRLARFYARRIRRLVPALALLIVVVALVGILAAPVGIQNVAAKTGASASVFLGNFYLYFVPKGYFAAGSDLNPFLHTWSLVGRGAVLPRVPAGAARRVEGRPARHVAPAAVRVRRARCCSGSPRSSSAGGSCTATRCRGSTTRWSSRSTRPPRVRGSSPPAPVLAFGQVRLRNMPRGLAVASSWIGIAIVLAVSLRYNATTLVPGDGGDRAGVRHDAAARGGRRRDRSASVGCWRGRRSCGSATCRTAGTCGTGRSSCSPRALWPGSYALGVAALLSLIPAYLSFRFVENPIRFNPRLNVRRTLVLGGSFIAVGLIASGGLILGNRWVEGTDGFAHVRAAFDGSSACPGGKARVGVDGEGQLRVRCTWPTAERDRERRAARRLQRPPHRPAHGARGPRRARRPLRRRRQRLPLRRRDDPHLGIRRADCKRFVASTLQVLDRTHPDVVVIGSSTNRYVNESKYTLQVGGSPARSPAPAAPSSSPGARACTRSSQQLAAKGIRTIVVHPVPKYPGWDLRGCAAGHVVIDEFACGRSMTRGTAEEESEDLDRSEDAAVAGIPQAETVGFLAQVCTPTQCATDRDGVWLYTDGDHLSAKGALRLTPHFTRVLHGALAGSS